MKWKKALISAGVCLLVLLLAAAALWYVNNRPQEASAPEGTATLWINGVRYDACPVWNGEPYFSLEKLAELGDGDVRDAFGLRIDVWDHSARLSGRKAEARTRLGTVSLPGACCYYQGKWYAPASVMSVLGLREAKDPQNGQRYYTKAPDPKCIPTGQDIVILRCHCVSDEIWGYESLFLSPSKVEAQISAMEEMGCSFLSFEDLDRINEYEKPVFITLDDGYEDNYTELFPILKRHNAKATIFLITDLIGKPYYLTEEEILEMDASGLVSFQSHTVHHANMNEATPEEREFEASESQLAIARLLKKVPFVMSFPKANANPDAMETVSRYYDYVVIADGEPWRTGSDPLHIPRFVMPRDIDMETFLSYFSCFE